MNRRGNIGIHEFLSENGVLTKMGMALKFRGSQGYMGIAVEECISMSQAYSTNDRLDGKSKIFMLKSRP